MTRSKAFPLALALTATMLTACGPFGAGSQPPSVRVSLPAPPSDLRDCFDKLVAAPGSGPVTAQQIVALVAALRKSELSKSACGQRLLAWYATVAEGLK